ncbi:MAG: PQQ-binding-like beta-propeller repeat protein [Xenococcus sp. MO_188.B8]|nr:PQQ-binding-like beta-propeller repeat protein [Xenococcus sp. MO_188.B8]
MTKASNSPPNWWMYHGNPGHTGYVECGSNICSTNVRQSLKVLHNIQLPGPILSVSAVVNRYIYVGIANSHQAKGSIGGSFFKINIQTGLIEGTFTWDIPLNERDSHGFTGMGTTPAVCEGKVYFTAFNGKLYCLDADNLKLCWVTDLRYADLAHNQPVTNDMGKGYPPAAGWSSPLVVNGGVYVGIGEGENPFLYSFVYCLDAQTGKVIWIFCTNQFEAGKNNQPNVLPAETIQGPLPEGFRVFEGEPVVKGCSVWSSIAYEPKLNQLYCGTGNAVPDGLLPSPGYSNGLLSLDASTGEFKAFFQVPVGSTYRPSDMDVDVGASPTIFVKPGINNDNPGTNPTATRTVVGIGGKSGGYFILDAKSLQLIGWRQLLPYYNDGSQIPTVDPHSGSDQLNPHVTNAESNATLGENYSGTYSCAAIHPDEQLLFIGMGGANYNFVAPGIDYTTTPFMRVINWDTLADAWPMDDHDPQRYLKARPPMYTTAGECGLSSPAVVNDLVFCSTSKLSIYAFDVKDGRLLWQDDIGEQTGGYNGGYGYCLGPAIWGNYVVAGGLVYGREGGILKVYALQET